VTSCAVAKRAILMSFREIIRAEDSRNSLREGMQRMGNAVYFKVQSVFLAMLASIAFIALPMNRAYSQQKAEQSLGPGWIYVNEAQGWVFWVYLPSRVMRGVIAEIWAVWNYRAVQNEGFGNHQSRRDFSEFHCVYRQERSGSASWHSQLHAGGALVERYSHNLSDTRNPPPQTILEVIMLVACRR
jgi:hypothetical protein